MIIKCGTIGMQTLVGTDDGPYPMNHGNCFSMYEGKVTREMVLSGETKDIGIINFYVENLEALIGQGIITLPVNVEVVHENGDLRWGKIIDDRIPAEWYSDRLCTICTPKHLLDQQA